jgi:hypothetical protein
MATATATAHAAPAPTVGRLLSVFFDEMTDLLIATPDGPERTRLIGLHSALSAQLQILIDNRVKTRLAEYAAATQSLVAATAQAAIAKNDLSQIATAITSIADAVSKITSLAARLP